MAQRLKIARFTGEGLELQDTGTSYAQSLLVTGTMVRGADLDAAASLSADGQDLVPWFGRLGGLMPRRRVTHCFGMEIKGCHQPH